MLNHALFVGGLLALPAPSQEAQWQPVREIRPDTQLEVILHDGTRVGGRLVSASATTLAFDIGRPLANGPPANVRLGTGAGIGMFAAGVGAPIGALAGGYKSATVYRAEKRP